MSLNKDTDTVLITYIYEPNEQTGKMMKSFRRFNVPIHNAFNRKRFMGNGFALQDIYKALLTLQKDYKYVIYADGGDTCMLKNFTPPDDILIYSTEKACYPHPSLAEQYPAPKSPWRFLNAGVWCAPIPLAIEFFSKYNLHNINKDVSGQHEIMLAYIQTIKDGFPMKLDEECEYFQSIAFNDPTDFTIKDGLLHNNITNTTPCIIHGNGLTDMSNIYNING